MRWEERKGLRGVGVLMVLLIVVLGCWGGICESTSFFEVPNFSKKLKGNEIFDLIYDFAIGNTGYYFQTDY